ncbi:IS66 family insertion sequence element accessory protein TnpB [Pseudomonas sp. Z1-14]
MIRLDTIWLATEPMDMRAGTDTAMARVISVSGAAQPHCAYLFANRRATRMKSWCTMGWASGWRHVGSTSANSLGLARATVHQWS